MPGTLASIVYSPQPGSYNRKSLHEALLIADFGIAGDRKGGHPRRNLNIMDQEMLDVLSSEGYPTGPGILGENLIFIGADISTQPRGCQFRIGHDVVIEVVRLREPCYKLTALDVRMPDAVIDRVGVMARIVQGGVVHLGDPVQMI